MKLSDVQIVEVVLLSKNILELLKIEGFRGKAKDEEFLSELGRRLKHMQSGERKNVCIHCVGTGYKVVTMAKIEVDKLNQNDNSCDRCETNKATEHFCESCLTEVINRGN